MATVPSTGTQIATLIRLTWMRMVRGRAVWVCFFIALAPMLLGFALRATTTGVKEAIAVVELIVMALVSPILVSSSIGDEIEDRTVTYLWSRPLPRWAMIVGKLFALAPVTMILVIIGWNLAMLLGTQGFPSLRTTLAFGAGSLAISTMTVGIATLVPRFGMALSIAYIVLIDGGIGAMPASLAEISVTRQVTLLLGIADESAIAQPLIAMAIIAAIWLAIGLRRIRKLEA